MDYEVKYCSDAIKRHIKGRAYTQQATLERKSRCIVPIEHLAVGDSIWCDLDTAKEGELHSIRSSVRYYNEKGIVQFVVHKHRGDMRKTGFKYLEVGRVK